MDYIAQFGFHWFWFGLGTVLLAVELLFNGRFMFMAASLAAVVIGILSHFFPYVSFPVQILFFVVTAAVFVWFGRSYLEARQARQRQQQHIVAQRSYLQRELVLISAIENGHSTQDVDGTVWTLRGPDLPAGSRVRVVDMGDGWLAVEPL